MNIKKSINKYILCLFTVIFLFTSVGCSQADNEKNTATPQNQQNTVSTNNDKKETGSAAATSNNNTQTTPTAVTPVTQSVPSPQPQPTPTPAPVQTSVVTPVQSDNKNITVYITKTGKKYHSAGCRYLSKSQIPINLKDAEAEGYDACSVCNPPR